MEPIKRMIYVIILRQILISHPIWFLGSHISAKATTTPTFFNWTAPLYFGVRKKSSGGHRNDTLVPAEILVRIKRQEYGDPNGKDLESAQTRAPSLNIPAPDQWDPNGPLVFNTDEWHMKQWDDADLPRRNIMREAFRSYFTARNAYIVRKMVFEKLYLTEPGEVRDECNPFFVGADFCGAHGDCIDLTIGNDTENEDENPFFICKCYEGWIGLFCERDIDECKQVVCQNGAYCEDLLPPRMFKCTCKPYTYGKTCDKEYPRSEEGFQCQSTDKSSLISWVPEENFKILDYFPSGLRNVRTMNPKSFRKFVSLKLKLERGLDIGTMAKTWLKTHATHVYVDHEKSPTIVESLRSPHHIRYYNDWGFNFNWIQTHQDSDIPFQHIIEMTFPAPVLVRGFVIRGGYEKKNVPKDCIACKRLVTRYKVTVRRGSSKWFRIRNPADSSEQIFNSLVPGERTATVEDLKRLDIEKPRYQPLNPPVSAEALRIHVVDWWPKELDMSSLLTTLAPYRDGTEPDNPPPHLHQVKNIGREQIARSQNPVMRIDVMGCHGMIL